MRFVVQRVNKAKVTVNQEVIGAIGRGFLVLVGVGGSDNQEIADKMIRKLIGLRIFQDQNGKTNLDLKAVNGALLIVSQFTLLRTAEKETDLPLRVRAHQRRRNGFTSTLSVNAGKKSTAWNTEALVRTCRWNSSTMDHSPSYWIRIGCDSQCF